jgi:tetratricopeptide (TPR) repeat protein
VVDLAVRLAEQAPPGEIVASARAARRLARRGAGALGVVAAAPRLRVADDSATLQAAPIRAATDTPFVGRIDELSTLDAELQGARRGTGRIVCITGDPGIGKSRLVARLLAGMPPTHVNAVAGLCQSVGRHAPLLPLRGLLLDLIGAGDTTDGGRISKALDRVLDRLGVAHPPFRAALHHLLGVGGPDEALIALGPAAVRARSFAALHELIARLGRQRPTVIVIEDLHWIDATSDAFLASLVERLRSMRVLLVVTRRPGTDPAWMTGAGVTRIVLGPLTASEGAQLVRAIWTRGVRSESLAHALFARSGGNPFFLEELTQVAMQEGTQTEVPLDVETVIATRIDQLSAPAKRALQAAAVIGSEVPRALLRPLMREPDAVYAGALAELAAADFLRESTGAGEPTLAFKHVLTREVAYGSMIARERRRFHADVAAVLRDRFPELAAARPEMLAQHAAAAGAHADAAEAWARAGERAAARSAFTEAHGHVRLGLALVDRIADLDLRKRLLIRLQLTLGQVLSMLRGFTDAEGAQALEAARALCDEIDDPAEVGRVLRTLWPVYFARARYPVVLEIGEALRRNGARAGELEQVSTAHAALGATRFFMGEFAAAARLLEDGVRDAAAAGRIRAGTARGYDFMVFCESYLARARWVLGAPASALAGGARAVAIAEAANAPWLKVQALYFSGVVHQYRRDPIRAQEFATRLLAVAEENEFRYWILLGRLLQGWCRERDGRGGGIPVIRAAIGDLERMGTVIGRAYFLCHLAECQLEAGDIDGAEAAIDRAFAASTQTGEGQWEPEQHRLRGEILMRRAAPVGDRAGARLRAAALASFRAARTRARELGAPALELRALLSLHAGDPAGASGRGACKAIAALLPRFDGDGAAADMAAAARIVRQGDRPADGGIRRNSAGTGRTRRASR